MFIVNSCIFIRSMKKNSFISKSIAALLLAVMMQTFFCSLLCAAGSYSCCDAMKKEKNCCGKSHHDNEGRESDNEGNDGCQKEHLAFFQAIGQVQFSKNIEEVKVFQQLIAVINTQPTFQPELIFDSGITYNCFHPPPHQVSIRIFIRSFLI